jgi:hypothetical protein
MGDWTILYRINIDAGSCNSIKNTWLRSSALSALDYFYFNNIAADLTRHIWRNFNSNRGCTLAINSLYAAGFNINCFTINDRVRWFGLFGHLRWFRLLRLVDHSGGR